MEGLSPPQFPECQQILINSIAGVVDNGIFAKNKPQVVLVSE